MISPDGQWIAYTSYESGNAQVYVRPFPNVDEGKWKISTNGGDFPMWSPDGRELFYRNLGDVIAVKFETEPTFSVTSSNILFSGNYVYQDHNQWDISPDGERFLMLKSASIGGSDYRINIVLNWFEELKERVSVD
jgi:Tol biopolymer transport system component